jgi:hypothetical protein
MNDDELVLRQQRLLMRSAELRLKLSDQTQLFKRPMAIVDHAQAALHWLYCNPKWPLGVLLVLVVLRPRRTLRWGSRLWWAWRTFKRAQSWITSLPLQRIKA